MFADISGNDNALGIGDSVQDGHQKLQILEWLSTHSVPTVIKVVTVSLKCWKNCVNHDQTVLSLLYGGKLSCTASLMLLGY